MRDRQLLTIDERQIIEQRANWRPISTTFIARENSVLDKLVAIGGGVELRETFEVQAKGIITSLEDFIESLHKAQLVVTLHTSRNHDTYFYFNDLPRAVTRYREDRIEERKPDAVLFTNTGWASP